MNIDDTAACTIEHEVWIKVEESEDKEESAAAVEQEKTIHNYTFSPTSHSCNICIKSFTNKYSLTRHLRTHIDIDKYKCVTCGKCFNDKSNLIQHERIHTGEKRYTCEECQMKFTHKATLNSHLLIHTGLKAFKCGHCGMFFARGHTMRKHINRKHSSGDKKRMKLIRIKNNK